LAGSTAAPATNCERGSLTGLGSKPGRTPTTALLLRLGHAFHAGLHLLLDLVRLGRASGRAARLLRAARKLERSEEEGNTDHHQCHAQGSQANSGLHNSTPFYEGGQTNSGSSGSCVLPQWSQRWRLPKADRIEGAETQPEARLARLRYPSRSTQTPDEPESRRGGLRGGRDRGARGFPPEEGTRLKRTNLRERSRKRASGA